MAQSSAWRGRRIDATGYINLGARYYDPQSGSFLDADPTWNERDPNYHSFAGGDPINWFDADGRLVIQEWQAAQQNLLMQGGAWNYTQAIGISVGYAAMQLFSVGSFGKNDRLADRNAAGEISDAQFYGGMTVNAAVAGASLYTGGVGGTFAAGQLVRAGATPLVGLTLSGAAAGFTSGVTDVGGTHLGYWGTGIRYEQTLGQDLTAIGYSTALGAGMGGLTYAGLRGEGVIYNRVDTTGQVDPYYGQAQSPERYDTRQAEHAADFPNSDFEFQQVDSGNPGRDLDFMEQWWITANGGSRTQNPNTPLSNDIRAMNDAEFWSTIENAMFNSGVMGSLGNTTSGVTLSRGH